jgi:hypothetical protein
MKIRAFKSGPLRNIFSGSVFVTMAVEMIIRIELLNSKLQLLLSPEIISEWHAKNSGKLLKMEKCVWYQCRPL